MGFRFAACFDCFALCLVSYLALANTRLFRRRRYREQRLPGVGETEISVDVMARSGVTRMVPAQGRQTEDFQRRIGEAK